MHISQASFSKYIVKYNSVISHTASATNRDFAGRNTRDAMYVLRNYILYIVTEGIYTILYCFMKQTGKKIDVTRNHTFHLGLWA